MSMKTCLILLVAVALAVAAPAAEPDSGPGDAESQGHEWAQKLCRARPETNLIQAGVLNSSPFFRRPSRQRSLQLGGQL